MRQSRHLILKRSFLLILVGVIFGFTAAMFRTANGTVDVPPGTVPPNGSGSIRRTGSNVGVGLNFLDPNPASILSVKGGMSVGVGYQGITATSGRLMVQGRLGIGVTNSVSKLAFAGGGLTINGIPQVVLSNERIPRANSEVSILVPDIGTNFSAIIGVDGNPLVAYLKKDFSSNTLTLEAIHCLNNGCTLREGPFILATHSNLPSIDGSGWTSIAIGNDGFPVIAYRSEVFNGNSTNFRLSVAKCNDVGCSDFQNVVVTQISDPDSSSDYGKVNRIVIGPDGFPLIAYFDIAYSKLKIAKCSGPDCSSSVVKILDSSFSHTDFGSLDLDIGPDGLPFVMYTKGSKVLGIHCRIADCSASDAPTTIFVTPVGSGILIVRAEMARGEDGLPIVAYETFSGSSPRTQLAVIQCGNVRCDFDNSVPGIIYSGDVDIEKFNIDIGPRSYPILIYNFFNSDMYFAGCTNHSCSEAVKLRIVNAPSDPYPIAQTILFGSDGLSMLVYLHGTNYVKLTKCGSETCIPYWTRR